MQSIVVHLFSCAKVDSWLDYVYELLVMGVRFKNDLFNFLDIYCGEESCYGNKFKTWFFNIKALKELMVTNTL